MWKPKFIKLSIKQIFLLGLLIRILVMPFFAHDDIFAEHRRAERIVCQGINPLSYSSWGVRLLESGFTALFTPFVSCDNLAQIQKSNTNVDNLNRMLFLFKTPYLLFEIGYWWLMWKLIKNKDKDMQTKGAIFLALNPVVIYSVYMFGRFEPYNLFLSALMLYILSLFDKKPQKKYVVAASAILAVILIIRFSYVLLIPALILSFAIPHALLTIAAFTISFLGLKALPMLLASGNNLIPEASGITSGTHQNYIYRSFIDLGGHKLYLFIFIFILIFLWSLERRDYINKLNKQLMFSLLSALTFLGFFATTYFHPQYITWLMPFFLLPILNDKNNFLWKTLWIFIPFYLLYLLNWKNATTFGLAAPISIVFYHIDPNDFIPILDITRWVNIARTAISGFFIYWIYYIFKYYGKTR